MLNVVPGDSPDLVRDGQVQLVQELEAARRLTKNMLVTFTFKVFRRYLLGFKGVKSTRVLGKCSSYLLFLRYFFLHLGKKCR